MLQILFIFMWNLWQGYAIIKIGFIPLISGAPHLYGRRTLEKGAGTVVCRAQN